MGISFKGEKQGHLESAWAGLLGRTFQVLASCELPKQRALGKRDWKEAAPLALSVVSWVDSLQSATTCHHNRHTDDSCESRRDKVRF